jgi:glutaredoxin|tara:strand:+ start:637 stop:897 length:261 start_codon:yes stop_codon:yes gene_type:complete
MQDRYILFVTKTCPYCEKAIKLLEEKKCKYKLVEFDEDQKLILEGIKTNYNWKTVPMIFKREKEVVEFIGGYTDLLKLFEDKDGTE